MRLALAALAIAAAPVPGWAAPFKQCKGVILKDSCNCGGTCPDGPTWRRGAVVEFMAWNDEDGHAVLVEYRIGSIAAADVKLQKGCALPKYE